MFRNREYSTSLPSTNYGVPQKLVQQNCPSCPSCPKPICPSCITLIKHSELILCPVCPSIAPFKLVEASKFNSQYEVGFVPPRQTYGQPSEILFEFLVIFEF